MIREEGQPDYLKGDARKLREILINLLENALKFTEQGGIELRVGKASDSAEFGPGLGAEHFRFEVEDTGIGIAPEEMDRLFRPFSQTSSGRFKGGTGLGLTISCEFARFMGGEISVTSEPGKGSLFRLLCPLERAAQSSVWPKAETRRVRGLVPAAEHPLILVADDQNDNRRLLVELLRSVGFRVCEANNGQAALDLFGVQSPDLVLMDLRMPVMDGIEATRLLKARDEGKDVPVVMITASVLEDQRTKIQASGADAILYKPFKDQALFEQLKTALRIEFLYEDIGDAPRKPAPSTASFALLSDTLLGRLRKAVEDGNFSELRKVTAEIKQLDQALAAYLEEMVQQMEFDRLAALIDDLQSSNA